ncbi:hypothetical protein [Proteus penneri]|uniref:Uncharacterized protein n=1 Tax=Proteus penneri TaxID=102862 RepID=A0A0G4QC10_9GAMM|nr:hypothetical protein [Proteus penneri]CRL63487.1 hypothetical protein BN1804_02506 [Proteus penneri]
MKIMDYCTQATPITDFNIDRKEKEKIKNSINSISNSFSSFYVREEKKSFSSKISFFIKKIFNIKTSLTFLLNTDQHGRLNNLSTLLEGCEKIEFKNNNLINSDFISIDNKSLDSFFLSLNIAIKNDTNDSAKKIIQNYLYEKSKTKADFITIMRISLDVINNFQKEKIEQFNKNNIEYASMLDYINFNYKQHIDMALNYACKEIDGKESNKLGNSIMYLVNTMHNIYSIEMEKNFIINIAKCFMDKVVKYNVENYNNDSFRKSIIKLLINKLKNNEGVREFVENMLDSGVLEYEDIIKEEEKTAGDECFISEHNRKMKKFFSNNENGNEIKNKIANIIRDNDKIILNKMKNNSNGLENKMVLLNIIEYLKSDNDWSLNLL